MKKFIHPGKTMKVTAPANVTADQIVKVGQLIGVALTDAASGAQVVIEMTGVYDGPKVTGTAVTQGAPAYWDNAAGKLTPTSATGLTLVGAFELAAASGATIARVRLDGVTRLPVA